MEYTLYAGLAVCIPKPEQAVCFYCRRHQKTEVGFVGLPDQGLSGVPAV